MNPPRKWRLGTPALRRRFCALGKRHTCLSSKPSQFLSALMNRQCLADRPSRFSTSKRISCLAVILLKPSWFDLLMSLYITSTSPSTPSGIIYLTSKDSPVFSVRTDHIPFEKINCAICGLLHFAHFAGCWSFKSPVNLLSTEL